MGAYLRPTQIEDAMAALAERPWAVLAGGTDFYPARVGRAVTEDVLDITALSPLKAIEEEPDHFHIGALVTWSELIRAELPACFVGLKLAAREVGGLQIQNAGTICGNLCNASPAADGAPNLLALDAEVELRSAAGGRRLPLGDFILGNRRTARREDELVTGLRIPRPSARACSTFLKLGARKYLVISIVMVGAVVETGSDSLIERIRIAVGACSAQAQRLPVLEQALVGQRLDRETAGLVREEHLAPLSPIDDVRGTAAYRADAALTLTRRAVASLAEAAP